MKHKTLGFIFATAASLLFAFTPSITQLAYKAGAGVNTVVADKYTIGLVLIWTFVLITKRNGRVSANQFVQLQITGVVCLITVNLMALSYVYLPGAICCLLLFIYVPIVNAVEVIMKRVAMTPMRLICIILTLVGLFIVVYTPSEGLDLSPRGIAIGVGAGVMYSIWAIRMGSPKVKSVGAEAMMGYIFMIPAVFMIARCIIEGDTLLPSGSTQWITILILGVCSGFLAPVFFAAAIKHFGASNAAMVNTSEPLIAYIAGIVLMSDVLTTHAIIGGIITTVGILLINFADRKGGNRIRGRRN